MNALVGAAAATGGLLVLSCALLLALAGSGNRRTTLGYLWVPLRTLAATVLVAACAGAVLMQLPRVEPVTSSSNGAQVALVIFLAGGTVMFCVSFLAMVLVGGNLVVKYCLRASDGHPTLPALVSLSVHVAMLGVAAAAASGSGVDPEVPYPCWLALSFGGPLVAIGCAVWELHRLRMRWGVTVQWSPAR